MGTLIYGNAGFSVEFDDRTLAHLQLVIGQKLRRHESFFFSWSQDSELSPAKTSVWVDKSIPLIFLCTLEQRHSLNHAWLELLAASATTAQGMQLMAEPSALVSA